MLTRHLRRRPNIKTTMGSCLLGWLARHLVCESQQTQNICITFVQCRSNVFDVGPTLYKCYTNVLCLPGYDRSYLLVKCLSGQSARMVTDATDRRAGGQTNPLLPR